MSFTIVSVKTTAIEEWRMGPCPVCGRLTELLDENGKPLENQLCERCFFTQMGNDLEDRRMKEHEGICLCCEEPLSEPSETGYCAACQQEMEDDWDHYDDNYPKVPCSSCGKLFEDCFGDGLCNGCYEAMKEKVARAKTHRPSLLLSLAASAILLPLIVAKTGLEAFFPEKKPAVAKPVHPVQSVIQEDAEPYSVGEDLDGDEPVSELQVLMSNAGYYIGRTQAGFPYDRQSGYYSTREKAQTALENGSFGYTFV